MADITTMMRAKMFRSNGELVVNVEAHPATFHKVWKSICADELTCSAAKYVNAPRRAFGVYVIDAPKGCSDAVADIALFGFGVQNNS